MESPYKDNRLVTRILVFLIVAGSVLVYLPALKAGFIWDDDFHFTANGNVARWHGIFDIWSPSGAMYYPLVLTTAWVVHKVFGFSPYIFHALNLGLHIANALLVIAVLRRFRIPGAWLAGFLFAWHPMQVESVAWVSELKNTQSMLFALLSVLSLQQAGFFQSAEFVERRSKEWYWVSVALFALALLSKPAVALLPLGLAAMVWQLRGIKRWMDVDGLFPHTILALLISGWTVWEQRYNSGAQGPEWSQGLIDRIALSGQVLWFYLRTLIWPHPVMFLYPKWDIAASHVVSWLPLAGFLAAGIVFWRKRDGWGRIPGIVLLWFALMLFPVAGFFNVYYMRYAWVADHFVYAASIALFAGTGAAWSLLCRRSRPAALAIAAILLAACGWGSRQHARTFNDPETLWRAAIQANPAAWMAHNNLGLLLRSQGDLAGARYEYEQALLYNPTHYEAMNNLGTMLQDQGAKKEALEWFDRALALKPELYNAWVNRGNLLRELGDIEGAYASYEKATDCDPRIEMAWVNIALLAEENGDASRAYRAYRSLLRNKRLSDEEIGGFLFERAYKTASFGHVSVAIEFLDKAGELAPNLADIDLLKGELYERLFDYSMAEKEYRKALNRRADWGAVVLRLARILAANPDVEKRQPKEAFKMLDAMMMAGGRGVLEIVDAYAMALAADGRYGEAIQAQMHAVKLTGKDEEKVRELLARQRVYEQGRSYALPSKPASGDGGSM